jgi:signal transduction histidine kinase
MRDRAGGVGGSLTVQSAPGKGTVVEMEVPGG